ncbi:MAG: ABC transporter ATP-binding protein [Treponema sp.]|nr:ABC transporter ATP-binding protein [Treponema sp.]
MLETNKLSVSYNVVPALHDISFYVDKGEVVSLIGPNGAGKTTTLHAVSGLLKRNKKSVFYNGDDISSAEAHKLVKKGISQVPEGRGIFPNLTVAENISLGAYVRTDTAEIKKDKEKVYALFPRLFERRAQICATLSGGELQMLSMARALMARPSLLLLDEPSMGLAPIIVDEIFKIISQINKEDNTTILLVEQNAQMALGVSDRAYVLEVGSIVNEGSAADLEKDDRIKKVYLGL